MAFSDDGETAFSLFPGLVRFKPTFEPGQAWEWELDAATSIEQLDPTHIKFTLRPGIQWTNGFGEVTTEDVKYSYERIADPANGMPYQTDWESLDYVEIIDKYTGVLVQKEPFVGLWTMVLPFGRANIICKAATEAVGGRFTTDPPATAGPYVIKEWVPKQRLILARDPQWNGRRPAFDEVHMIQIDDDKAAEIAFEAGEIDFTKVALSSIPAFQKNPPANATVDPRPLVGGEWIGMNVEHPPFDDIRVRRAVQLAVDVELVLDAVYYGLATRATGIVPQGILGHRGYNLYPERRRPEVLAAPFHARLTSRDHRRACPLPLRGRGHGVDSGRRETLPESLVRPTRQLTAGGADRPTVAPIRAPPRPGAHQRRRSGGR